tara:strand:- start:8568 stop:8951 length:384 start_codon:yes stop_codon:yes gene_type:complete
MTIKTNETDSILDAIREMMGEKDDQGNTQIPKDILDLTKPIEISNNQEPVDILELNNPIENENTLIDETVASDNINIDEDSIRTAIQKKVDSISLERIDEIIREELERVISKRLKSVEINFSSNKDS